MNRLPPIDMLSFWIGFIVASIFWAIISALRPSLRNAIAAIKKQREEAKLRVGSNIEDSHRRNIYNQAQEMHLAASLFSLNEIAIEPRLMAPPAQIEPGMDAHHQSMVEKTLPYLPESPEMSAFYGAPGLGLAEALSGKVNIIITGQPGAGKSTALAHLACQIAEQHPAAASLHERIPFLLHVSDLGLPLAEAKKPEDLLAPIVETQSARMRILDRSRVPNFVQYAFQSGRALLLLDGLDEMPQPQIQEASAYLRLLLRAYPQIRILVAGAPEYIDGLLQLGFVPLALQAWMPQQQQEYLQKWDSLWGQYVRDESWAQTAPAVDNLLLKRWLAQDNLGLTPLEYTLKIWAAYAGDVRGSNIPDHIEAHIRRLSPGNIPSEALQLLAAQSSLNQMAAFEEKQAREWVKAFEQVIAQDTPEPEPAAETETGEAESEPTVETEAGEPESAPETVQEEKEPAKKSASVTDTSLVGKLAGSGLLKKLPKNRFCFSHPAFAAYLTGQALRGPGAAEPILKQPAWSGRTQVMRYLAAFTDATPLIQTLLNEEDDPILLRPQRQIAMLVRHAPRNAPWRNSAIAGLLEVLQNDEHPLALRGEIISAFALTGDPHIAALFRQLLQSPSDKLRQLA
ncbi:MAG: NACHT domain-containing protein, partial [Anaerolineales bacterium]